MNQKQLKVGAARMTLGYPEEFFPHKSFRGRYFTGVHDDLHARAIYIESTDKTLIVSLELGDIGDQWLDDIAVATGVPKQNIFLTAAHTHSAPHVHATIREDVIDQEKGKEFEVLCRETVLECTKKAVASAQEATVEHQTGRADINVNRDYKCVGPKAPSAPYIQAQNLTGPSDKTLDVIRFADLNGKSIAYIVNYAIHSIVTFYQTWTYEDSMLVSSDLVGSAMSYVEDRIDNDAIVMFTMAAAGDQIPKYVGNHRTFGRDGEVGWEYYGREASFKLNDAQASLFGREILNVINAMDHGEAEATVRTASCTVHPMGKVEGWNTKETSFKEDVKADGNSYAAQYKESAVPDFEYTPTQPHPVTMGLLRVGEINFVLVPAELVCAVGADIKKLVNEKLGGYTVVVTQCNGAYSYIVDRYSYDEMTFEAIASHFMPGSAEVLLEGIGSMAEQLRVAKEDET